MVSISIWREILKWLRLVYSGFGTDTAHIHEGGYEPSGTKKEYVPTVYDDAQTPGQSYMRNRVALSRRLQKPDPGQTDFDTVTTLYSYDPHGNVKQLWQVQHSKAYHKNGTYTSYVHPYEDRSKRIKVALHHTPTWKLLNDSIIDDGQGIKLRIDYIYEDVLILSNISFKGTSVFLKAKDQTTIPVEDTTNYQNKI